MKISAKVSYACRALIELCLHWPNKVPLQINTIAQNQEIPIKFLTHILINLKQLGYVDSIRGKNGGYLLRRHPKEIKLGDVVEHLGGVGFGPSENVPLDKASQVLEEIWGEIHASLLSKMSEINFDIICNRLRRKEKVMTFEI